MYLCLVSGKRLLVLNRGRLGESRMGMGESAKCVLVRSGERVEVKERE